MAYLSLRQSVHRELTPWQARRAFAFIRANLGRTIEIEHLAAAARLGAGRFSAAFHAEFGLSPHAYLIRRRVKHAQEQMLFTDKPLAGIATACGFADQAHFTQVFRRIVGVTPARWRQLHRSPIGKLPSDKDAGDTNIASGVLAHQTGAAVQHSADLAATAPSSREAAPRPALPAPPVAAWR